MKTPPKLCYLCRLQTADIWIFIATLPWCTLVAKESSGKVLAPSSTHGGKEHQFGLYDMVEQLRSRIKLKEKQHCKGSAYEPLISNVTMGF